MIAVICHAGCSLRLEDRLNGLVRRARTAGLSVRWCSSLHRRMQFICFPCGPELLLLVRATWTRNACRVSRYQTVSSGDACSACQETWRLEDCHSADWTTESGTQYCLCPVQQTISRASGVQGVSVTLQKLEKSSGRICGCSSVCSEAHTVHVLSPRTMFWRT
jgi:hypothetical protein